MTQARYIVVILLIAFGQGEGRLGYERHARSVASTRKSKPLLLWGNKFVANFTDAIVAKPINASKDTSPQVVLKGVFQSEFGALATDYHNGRIYYTDYFSDYLGVYLVKTGLHYTFLRGRSFGIDDISVDWLSGNLYWVDSKENKISVANKNFRYFHDLTLINTTMPSQLAVDAINKHLYWSEKNGGMALWKSDLNGQNKVVLHRFTGVESIDDIFVHAGTNRVYWSESLINSRFRTSRVRYFEASKPQEVREEYSEDQSRFSGVAYYKGSLYLCNKRKMRIISVESSTGRVSVLYGGPRGQHLSTMTVYASDLQPYSPSHVHSHPCVPSNPCGQLCLANPGGGYTCACSVGYVLADDKRFCNIDVLKSDFVLVFDAPTRRIYQISLSKPLLYNVIPVNTTGQSQAIDYDPVAAKLYWADESTRRIYRSSYNGKDVEIFMNQVMTFSIAVDYVSRNLYVVDSVSHTIFVASLELPNLRHTLIWRGTHSLRQITISSVLGKLFWVDWGFRYNGRTQVGHIAMSDLDGRNWKILFHGTYNPVGLTLDEDREILFWTESRNNTIGWYDINRKTYGKYEYKFSNKFGASLAGLAYYSSYLYLTKNDRSVTRISTLEVLGLTKNKTIQQFGPGVFYALSYVKIHLTNRHQGFTKCHEKRGGCPQICVPGPQFQAICRCTDTTRYLANNNTCSQPKIDVSKDVTPPSFGNTCPKDQFLLTDSCSNTTTFMFYPPRATDNSGYVIVKPISGPVNPYRVGIGLHMYTFVATDLVGNTAFCQFLVNVEARHCHHLSPITTFERYTTISCGNKLGSVLQVHCYNTTLISREFVCKASGRWEEKFDNSALCVSRKTASGPIQTTAQQATATNSVVNAETETTKSLTTTTASSLETQTNKISKETTDLAEAFSQDQTNETNTIDATGSNRFGQPQKKPQPGLNGGVIAAIVVLIALAAVAAVVLYSRFRNKKTWSLAFWKQSDDTVQLTAEEPIYTEGRSPVDEPQRDLLI